MPYSYVCSKIQDWIKKERDAKRYTTHECKVENPQLFLTVHTHADEKDDPMLIFATVWAMTKWIRSMPISIYDPKEDWSISIWMTPFPLRWCSSEKVLDACSINSAFTETIPGKSIKIEIGRRESLGRTILHELLHAHRWDRMSESKIDKPRFKCEYEALVESSARILYCQWLADNPKMMLSHKDHVLLQAAPNSKHNEKQDDKKIVREHWTTYLNKEIAHSNRVAKFLWSHKWKAQTHVSEYYLCTAAILSIWKEFWNWLWVQSFTPRLSDNARRPSTGKTSISTSFTVLLSNAFDLYFKDIPRYSKSKDKIQECASIRMVPVSLELNWAYKGLIEIPLTDFTTD
jgi:hypothetical protein